MAKRDDDWLLAELRQVRLAMRRPKARDWPKREPEQTATEPTSEAPEKPDDKPA